MVMEGNMLLPPGERLIVALDVPSADHALDLVETLSPAVSRFKVGLQLYTVAGPSILRQLRERGAAVFLDLKLHDIPNTVSAALEGCVQPGVFLVDVHATGGRAMLEAAVASVERTSKALGIARPKVLGVTLLTHLHVSDLIEMGFREPKAAETASDGGAGWISRQVCGLARICQESGLDGVVASPHELQAVREEVGPGFLVVTPGIRPSGTELNDQVRVATPTRAMRGGASYIVVGRPITEADDPLDAARRIIREMEDAFLIA